MKKIFVINSGSSSIKFQCIEMPQEKVTFKGLVENIGNKFSCLKIFNDKKQENRHLKLDNHEIAFSYLFNYLIDYGWLNSFKEIDGCGHRIAHGGEYFKDSVIFNDYVSDKINELSILAPLHNPNNLMGYIKAHKVISDKIHVAVFDTSFHQTMSKEIYIYPIPYEYYEKYRIRKYGFHGINMCYITMMANKILKDNYHRLIICHLGNGASVTAVKNGKCINTSMGLTPLGGLMMGTRSGDLDPSVIEFICKKENKDVESVLNELNCDSGLLGISAISNDVREIYKKVSLNDDKAVLSLEIFARRVADYIGSYFIHLGGLDAIIFTAGIGENDFNLRKKIITCIKDSLKIKLDENKNKQNQVEVSACDSKVKVLIIPSNEELMIAKEVYKHLKNLSN